MFNGFRINEGAALTPTLSTAIVKEIENAFTCVSTFDITVIEIQLKLILIRVWTFHSAIVGSSPRYDKGVMIGAVQLPAPTLPVSYLKKEKEVLNLVRVYHL